MKMFTIRLSTFTLLLFTICTQLEAETAEKSCLRTEAKQTFASLSQSFKKFFNKVKNFFTKPFKRFEKIRRKIKKAFYRFINESISSDYEHLMARQLTLENQFHHDSQMTLSELIVSQGFRVETHTALTKDGYMITLHRIFKVSANSSRTGGKLVLVHHGLWGSAIDWVLLGPKEALPYLLLESGYDVWLINARGNKYSNAHVTKTTDSIEYWNFSWHEIGLFDISAIIDYVAEYTEGKSEINFVAYSMGGTALLVLLSTLPQYNTILRSAILIAPLVFMQHVKGPMRYLANLYGKNDLSFLSHNGSTEFGPITDFSESVKEEYCKGSKILCANPLLLMGDGGKLMSNINLTAKVLSHAPAGGSKKTLLHYLQLMKSGNFQMFDYGTPNRIIYGTEMAPLYQLQNISLPIVIFNSRDDWLCTTKDIANLINHIPSTVSHRIILRNGFSHLDFLWGDDVPKQVYLPILKYLKKIDFETQH